MYQTQLETTQLGQTGLQITRVGPVETLQPQYSLIERDIDPILPAASLELTDEDLAEIEGSGR